MTHDFLDKIKLQNTVKQVDFAGNLILRISWKVQIREIKLLQNCKFYMTTTLSFQFFAKIASKLACFTVFMQ